MVGDIWRPGHLLESRLDFVDRAFGKRLCEGDVGSHILATVPLERFCEMNVGSHIFAIMPFGRATC